MITILDYGLGNIKALCNIYSNLNIPFKLASKESDLDLDSADKLILPGVGSFDYAINKLINSGMKEKLEDLVLNRKIPILGICVGMQMMAKSSEEGLQKGLGWVDANVKKFEKKIFKDSKFNFDHPKSKNKALILPHMGWNDVEIKFNCPILENITNPKFYFLHSFYFLPQNDNRIIGTTKYSIDFCSIFRKNNIFGVQFHPEKSHHSGIKLLANFSKL